MLYGHPELTNDRKPPKDMADRLARSFPKIRVAWHNQFTCWVVLQEPDRTMGDGHPWDFVLVCNNPATGVPKELGPWIFRWLEMNYEATEDLQKHVLDAQKKSAAARAARRAAWREQEVAEPIARRMFPDLWKGRASFAGLNAGKNVPSAAAFKETDSGLLVPKGGG